MTDTNAILFMLFILLWFCFGVLVGVRLTWWHMNREWRRNPHQFIAIAQAVIVLREARDKKEGEAK